MNPPSAQQRLARRLCLGSTLGLLLATGAYQLRFGDVFPPHGLGPGDSHYYAWMARDFPEVVLGRQLDAYRIQRVLPAAVVYAGLRAFGRHPQLEQELVTPFRLLNLLMLGITLVVWHDIADVTSLSVAGRWLGALLMFSNFACANYLFYLPVLTDSTALAIGALLVSGYLRSNAWLLVGGLLAGAFSWPAVLLPAAPLLVFPRRTLAPEPSAPAGAHWYAAAVAGLGYLALVTVALLRPVHFQDAPEGLGVVALHRSALPLSLAVALFVVVMGVGLLVEGGALVRPSTYLGGLSRRRTVAFLLAALLAWLARSFYASAPTIYPFHVFIRYLAVQPVLRPAQSLVAAVAFFGLLPLFLVARWRAVCGAARELGVGMSLFLASLLALSSSSESRQLFHGIPALTLLVVLALEGVRLPRLAPWLLAGLAAFSTKLWLTIDPSFTNKSHPLSYPAQLWWMNLGPWMADETYAVQGGIALVSLAVVAGALRGARALGADERGAVWPSNRAVLAFPAAALALALAAAAVEWPARTELRRREAARLEDSLSRADAELGWRNVPGARRRLRTGEYDVEVAINSRGLRGPEREYARNAARRVLLLGGSAAEAYCVREEASLRARVEAELRTRGCGGVEVLNAGVARYSTEQQLDFFRAEGARYRPQAVVVVFSHEDMLSAIHRAGFEDEGEPETAPRRIARVPSNLRLPKEPLYYWHDSAALRLLSNYTLERWPVVHARLGSVGLVEYGRPPKQLWPYGLRPEVDSAWERTEDALDELREDASRLGAPVLLLYAPASFEVDSRAWDETLARYRMSPRFWASARVARRLGRVAQSLRIPLVDPRDALRGSTTSTYFPREGLWTEAGNALAAAQLAPALASALACR